MRACVTPFTETQHFSRGEKILMEVVYKYIAACQIQVRWHIRTRHVTLCISIAYHNGLPYLHQSSWIL